MTKGSTRSSRVISTTPLPSLKQARLVGINDNLKSIRQKPTTSDSTHNELKQTGLAAFGFGVNTSKRTPQQQRAIETPPSKKRKVTTNLEVPETQFAQNTQSPEPIYCNPFTNLGDEYSSPLSSPPSECSSPIVPSSISSLAVMPPPPLPAAPVTPKRRRVTEIPDSKSPPFTPFTPYKSQQDKNRLDSQSSPTPRLSKSPIALRIGEDDDEGSETSSECGSPTPVSTQILPQKPSALSPRLLPKPKRLWQGGNGEEDEQGENTTKIQEVTEMIEVDFSDKDKVIKSSQWWENEDTQDAPLSTQYTQDKQLEETAAASGGLWRNMDLQEPIIRPIHDEESFRVNLSYNSDPPLEITESDSVSNYEPHDAGWMDHEEDIQESFRSMTYPIPLKFHDDTPEPDFGDDPALPMDSDFPGSTASEEDPEEINESQEYPTYGAYRTQQFPSSFYQHNAYRHSSPEFPPSSQFVPSIIINRTNSAVTDENRGEEPSQFLPEPACEVNAIAGESGTGEKEPSQFLPGTMDKPDAATTDDSRLLLVMINNSDAVAGGGRDGSNHEEEQDVDIKDEDSDDDGDDEGRRGSRTRTVTRSQLLPSELMETFPMPPPISQFSSYGPYSYEFESETQ